MASKRNKGKARIKKSLKVIRDFLTSGLSRKCHAHRSKVDYKRLSDKALRRMLYEEYEEEI